MSRCSCTPPLRSRGFLRWNSGGCAAGPKSFTTWMKQVSTAWDLDGNRVVSAAAVEAMTVSYTGDLPAGYAPGVGQGLGFEVVTQPLRMHR